ncbi:MAG: hypothetical protein Fur0040_00650 [Sideroxydans sp.]
MSSERAGELNEQRIEADGMHFDLALDQPVRQALEKSQVLADGATAPEDSGNLLQAAMRLKNMNRQRQLEEARLRELEAQVRAEALATVKLRKQVAQLAAVEARARNIARVRAETVARLAELEQRIRDDALATVALRQEIARRQAQDVASPALPESPPADSLMLAETPPTPPIEPPGEAAHEVPVAASLPLRRPVRVLAWSGWGVAAALLVLWWATPRQLPAPAAQPVAAPAPPPQVAPVLPPSGEAAWSLKLDTELHTAPR